MSNKTKIGIIGYGNFGKFITTHLIEVGLEVLIYDPAYPESNTLAEVCDCEYLILAVTVNHFESVCSDLRLLVPKSTVIIDVTSIKVLPLQILQKYFPENQILGTHPIFGPQSGGGGIRGLSIVLCNVSCDSETYKKIQNFISETLELIIIEMSSETHDREMAYVQGLSHFIGRALARMDIPVFVTATKSYQHLVELERMVGSDSWELYQTIQKGNSYAEGVRKEFLGILQSLNANESK